MKLTLVVLAVLVGVAVSSPLNNKLDTLIDDLLEKLAKREEGPAKGSGVPAEKPAEKPDGTSGSGAPEKKPAEKPAEKPDGTSGSGAPEKKPAEKPDAGSGSGSQGGKSSEGSSETSSEEREAKEDEKKIDEIMEKSGKQMMRHIKRLDDLCRFNLTRHMFQSQVSMADVGRVFTRIHRVFGRLAAKFDTHKDLLAAVEDMEEDDESTENHAKLIQKFGEIPNNGLLKDVVCALGSIKIFVARAKYLGMHNKDFPEVKNCLDTCGQLMHLYPKLFKGELPEVDVQKAKANALADYKCIKSHVVGVNDMLVKGAAEYEKTKKTPSAGQIVTIVAMMEHIIEGLGVRGMQLHSCASALHNIAAQRKEMDAKESAAAPSRRELESLLTALRSL